MVGRLLTLIVRLQCAQFVVLALVLIIRPSAFYEYFLRTTPATSGYDSLCRSFLLGLILCIAAMFAAISGAAPWNRAPSLLVLRPLLRYCAAGYLALAYTQLLHNHNDGFTVYCFCVLNLVLICAGIFLWHPYHSTVRDAHARAHSSPTDEDNNYNRYSLLLTLRATYLLCGADAFFSYMLLCRDFVLQNPHLFAGENAYHRMLVNSFRVFFVGGLMGAATVTKSLHDSKALLQAATLFPMVTIVATLYHIEMFTCSHTYSEHYVFAHALLLVLQLNACWPCRTNMTTLLRFFAISAFANACHGLFHVRHYVSVSCPFIRDVTQGTEHVGMLVALHDIVFGLFFVAMSAWDKEENVQRLFVRAVAFGYALIVIGQYVYYDYTDRTACARAIIALGVGYHRNMDTHSRFVVSRYCGLGTAWEATFQKCRFVRRYVSTEVPPVDGGSGRSSSAAVTKNVPKKPSNARKSSVKRSDTPAVSASRAKIKRE